jgi:hypothetical protein
MRRIVTAREQHEMLAALHPPILAALPADVPRAHWRSTGETGGEFDSSIRPASHVDVPHPMEVFGAEGYRKWVAARGGKPKDPVNDPWGILDEYHLTFDQMKQNKVNHYNAQNKAEGLLGRIWYRTFHDVTGELADRASRIKSWGPTSRQRVVDLFSNFSPLTEWSDNIRYASNFIKNYDGDPAKRHEWKAANIHPLALRRWRAKYGNGAVPSDSDEDLNELADMHDGIEVTKPGAKRGQYRVQKPMQRLRDPAARAEWIDNIRARGGIGQALDRHTNEVVKAHGDPAKKNIQLRNEETRRPIPATDAYGEVQRNRNGALNARYSPDSEFTYTHPSVPTIGDHIASGIAIHDADEEGFKRILGDSTGRKRQSFAINGADETPLRPARPGVAEDHGYHEHPIGEDGKPDWTRSSDQEYTGDTHDLRAMATPADADSKYFASVTYDTPYWFGGTKISPSKPRGLRKNIAPKGGRDMRFTGSQVTHNGKNYDLAYDLAHRANWAATKAVNDAQPDEYKHIIPKQMQAGVWGRFKNMMARATGKKQKGDRDWWKELPGYEDVVEQYHRNEEEDRQQEERDRLLREERERQQQAPTAVTASLRGGGPGLFDGIGTTWPEMLGNWVDAHFKELGEHPSEQYPTDLNIHDTPTGRTTMDDRNEPGELTAARRALAAADEVLGRELLAGARDVLSYSGSLIKRSIHEHLIGTSYDDKPEWADRMFKYVQENPNGMTFKHDPDDGPRTGQMVSYPKKEVERVIPMDELTPRHLHDYYLNDYAHRINERADNYGGGWLAGPPSFNPEDPDDIARWGPQGPRQVPHYYLDVSRNEDDPHTMMGEAMAHDQDGMYDLNVFGKGDISTGNAFHQIYPEQPHQFWTGGRR